MEIYVIDTSVITKWFSFVDEKHINQARKILELMIAGHIQVFIPDLAVYELGNVLLKSKKRPAQETLETIVEFLSFPLTIIPYSKELLQISTEIAEEYNLTIYDAAFLAVAKLHDAALVTENQKDQGKVKEVKVIPIANFLLRNFTNNRTI